MLPTATAACAARGAGSSPCGSILDHFPVGKSMMCTSFVAPASRIPARSKASAAAHRQDHAPRDQASEAMCTHLLLSLLAASLHRGLPAPLRLLHDVPGQLTVRASTLGCRSVASPTRTEHDQLGVGQSLLAADDDRERVPASWTREAALDWERDGQRSRLNMIAFHDCLSQQIKSRTTRPRK